MIKKGTDNFTHFLHQSESKIENFEGKIDNSMQDIHNFNFNQNINSLQGLNQVESN